MVFIIIGIILILSGIIVSICDDSDEGIPFSILGVVWLMVSLMPIFMKDYDYKDFKIKYDNIKEIYTSKDDIRDATFTQNILEINEKIRECREYKDDIFYGIYQIKRICNLELLEKKGG